jgi:hypothetical protein
LLAPQYQAVISRWMMPFSFGELFFMFWLLIMGAAPKPTSSTAAATAVK